MVLPVDDPDKSYRTLRRIVGGLGVLLPIVLATWGFALCSCPTLAPSISAYYYGRTRDALVGTLFAIGWFLVSYHGYDRRDDWVASGAGIAALLVALFPTGESGWEPWVHFASAAVLFSLLAYFCLFLFTKTDGSLTPQKLKRNTVYRVCGVAIVACILLSGVYYLIYRANPDTPLAAFKPIFWLESLGLWAFGVSWFVKGETILRDKSRAA